MVKTAWLSRASTLVASVTMACFGITSMASAQTITNTGPGSTNTINSNVTNNCNVQNNNNISSNNSNSQSATSGDASSTGNTSAGLPWTGWGTFDPSVWQGNDQSYASWWSGVANWVSQRAGGEGWNSTSSNLTWSPSDTGWNGYDPMTWQQNGQSFNNWFAGVQAYMNGNSANWLLSWPTGATGNGMSEGGASSGDANNFNSANFTINIVNRAAPGTFGTGECGTSMPTPGGMGGGTYTPPVGGSGGGSSYVTPHYGGSGGGAYSGNATYYRPVVHAVAPVAVSAPAPVAVSPVVMPVTPVTPSAPASSISNTGPGSTNTINSNVSSNTSVQNNNNVSVTNTNTQSANTGDSNSSGNTTTGGGGSGDATNGNASGGSVGLTN